MIPNKFVLQAEFRESNLDDRASMLWKHADFIIATKGDRLTWSLYSMHGLTIELTYSIHHDRIEKIEIVNDASPLEKYMTEISIEAC